MEEIIVETKNLKKFFPSKKGAVKAVNGVDLKVKKGEVFGFLGPNGAGKTTTLRMLTTLITPDSGTAKVAGFDVKKNPNEVRKRIGYVSQVGGADRPATGVENLILQGRLYGMTAQDARARAKELIGLLDLKEFADRIVHTYSGGQRRRLDVALGLMNRPEVLFLDEPTTGLDPQNRANLWKQISKLKSEGATIFLTTHYLEEADALSDRLAIMDYGKIVALGTPQALKKEVSGDSVIIGVENPENNNQKVIEILKKEKFVIKSSVEQDHLKIYVRDGATAMPQILNILNFHKIKIITITLTETSLDDVFLKKTGHSLRDTGAEGGN
jgi:ABC-2 type transport system ATP-binding protein